MWEIFFSLATGRRAFLAFKAIWTVHEIANETNAAPTSVNVCSLFAPIACVCVGAAPLAALLRFICVYCAVQFFTVSLLLLSCSVAKLKYFIEHDLLHQVKPRFNRKKKRMELSLLIREFVNLRD